MDLIQNAYLKMMIKFPLFLNIKTNIFKKLKLIEYHFLILLMNLTILNKDKNMIYRIIFGVMKSIIMLPMKGKFLKKYSIKILNIFL